MPDHTFVLRSMGCKSNQFEGSLVIEQLVLSGFTAANDLSAADFFILNSCTVTEKSDTEALYHLRHAKRSNPKIKTVITGCLAQTEKEKLLKLPFIDYVFGNDDKFDMPNLLLNDIKTKITDLSNTEEFNYQVLNEISRTRFSLKIQDGCNNRCAYCIIPFARGKSRSASSEFIINQINHAAEIGFKEVVFTGIHIGQWGAEKHKTLFDLLKEVENKTTITRYRLGSLNPLEISSDLLNLLQNSNKFCPHFHLSLQSACDKTLRAMKRFYNTDNYLEQIEDITQRFDKPFIGADIIAGFCGETEDDFELTVSNLKKAKLTKIHTFPYSKRKGTFAETQSGHLPEKVKKQRAEVIKKISNMKFAEFLRKNTGTVHEVLIEKRPDKRTGLLKGVTRNYLNVLIENTNGAENYFNTLQKVQILGVEKGMCIGELLY